MHAQPGEEVALPIPSNLQQHLEDDCYWISRKDKVVSTTKVLYQVLGHIWPRRGRAHGAGLSRASQQRVWLARDYCQTGLATVLNLFHLFSQLVSLPRSPTVSQLLVDFYHHYCEQHSSSTTDVKYVDQILFVSMDSYPSAPYTHTRTSSIHLAREILDGLKTYFDFTLRDHLLYASEVSQFDSVMEGSSLPPSSVYGPEHLLRLFVRMPHFLCQAHMPPVVIQILHHHFKELFTYVRRILY